MEAGGAGNGSNGAAQTKGSGGDGSTKTPPPLPPCCVKARAAAPESEAKCHATVVSGWFTEPRSHCGTPLVVLLRDMYCTTLLLLTVIC
jgi:spermidine synthase